jgi:hypothetical protein
MIIASSVVSPFSSGEPPRPTDPSQPHSMPEKGCRFSQKLQPISTASSAVEPAANRCQAALVALAKPFCAQVLTTVVREAGCAEPITSEAKTHGRMNRASMGGDLEDSV